MLTPKLSCWTPTDQLSPEGAAVLVEAKHMAEGPDAPLHLTSAAHGVFAEPNSTRATVRCLDVAKL